MHSVVLTEDHRVFTWGSNTYNQLGRTTNHRAPDPTPGQIDPAQYNNEVPKVVAAQNDNTYILTEEGNIYAFGKCDNAQCPGLDKTTNKLETGFAVNNIWTGEKTIFAIDKNGDMYAAGENSLNQLCLDDSYNADGGHLVTKLTKINIANATYVSQGPYHTLFKLGTQVVGCGNNQEF